MQVRTTIVGFSGAVGPQCRNVNAVNQKPNGAKSSITDHVGFAPIPVGPAARRVPVSGRSVIGSVKHEAAAEPCPPTSSMWQLLGGWQRKGRPPMGIDRTARSNASRSTGTHMLVDLKNAMDLADRFEALLETKGVSIGAHGSTGADMLPLWYILERIRKGFVGTPDDHRAEYAAGIAVHDLAAKILAVENHPGFGMLVPHLAMLTSGAVHLTQEPPPNADIYNKLVEIYWASLLMANGVEVALDHPKHSKGDNPDVIALDNGQPARAYAFKTVRSEHTQNLLDHLVKGVEQIERSDVNEGIVCFQLTSRILRAGLWPEGSYYIDWRLPASQAVTRLNQMISQMVIDNGQPAIDAVFAGKKAAGSVLCLALFPTVARNPITGNPVVMPIKVATLVEMVPSRPMSPALHAEIEAANHRMQTQLR